MSDERLRVCEDAKRAVNDLIRLSADGNRLVVITVLRLAHELVAALDSIVQARPKLGRSLARNRLMWPAFISRKRLVRQGNEELLNTLQLGEGGMVSIGEWHPSAPSAYAAMIVFCEGQECAEAGQGPRLSGKNKKQWFAETWDWLLANGFKPEQSLGELGASKAGKKPKYCKDLHPATRLSNVRSEIRARVWEAFDKMFYPAK